MQAFGFKDSRIGGVGFSFKVWEIRNWHSRVDVELKVQEATLEGGL